MNRDTVNMYNRIKLKFKWISNVNMAVVQYIYRMLPCKSRPVYVARQKLIVIYIHQWQAIPPPSGQFPLPPGQFPFSPGQLRQDNSPRTIATGQFPPDNSPRTIPPDNSPRTIPPGQFPLLDNSPRTIPPGQFPLLDIFPSDNSPRFSLIVS